jgi:hypothetical protein
MPPSHRPNSSGAGLNAAALGPRTGRRPERERRRGGLQRLRQDLYDRSAISILIGPQKNRRHRGRELHKPAAQNADACRGGTGEIT